MPITVSNELLTAALDYASRGWAVLPLHSPVAGRCSCGRSDCSSPGKHPRTRNGLADASTDTATIEQWWRQWPAANIGVRTGEGSGLVVLDVDVDHGGDVTLAELLAEHGPFVDDTMSVRTGSGGAHWYFAHPGEKIRNDAGRKLGAGLDVRGDGGYVVAPPSLHASGDAYSWSAGATTPALPPWLHERLQEPPAVQRAPAAPLAPRPADGRQSRYATEALERELAELGQAPPGNRNHALNRASYNLAQLVAGGELEHGQVESRLLEVALHIGLGEGEARATIGSGMSKGLTIPRRAPERPARTSPRRPSGNPVHRETAAPPNGSAPPLRPAEPGGHRAFKLTDLGNAERLVARHGQDLRYCHPLSTWFVWDGRRWRRDASGEVMRRAKETVRSIYAEASAEHLDRAECKEISNHAQRSEGSGRLKAMVELAQNEPGIHVQLEDLDTGPWALNCRNGTIDLRDGTLHPHRREDLLTKITNVDYDPDARLEMWDSFLDDITRGDAELLRFLQRAAGYSATGLVSEEVLFFVHGPAATGKSTFMAALRATFGDYAMTAEFETFLARSNVGGPRGDIVRTVGARLLMSLEVDEGKRLAEGLVKQITGGDKITAAAKFKDEIEFIPQFALWLVANHAPRLRDDDEAMWRRIHRIPFDNVVPRDQRNPRLKSTLENPAKAGPAILAWIVRGAVDWRANGLGVPKSVELATETYRADMDPLRDFISDHCVLDSGAFVPVKELRAAYESWARDTGTRPLGPRAVNERLQARGCTQSKRRVGGPTTRCWDGIGLLDVEHVAEQGVLSDTGEC